MREKRLSYLGFIFLEHILFLFFISKVWFSETCHVVGLALLAFIILPDLDVIKGVMLANSVCLLPAILSMNKLSIIFNFFREIICIIHYANIFSRHFGMVI